MDLSELDFKYIGSWPLLFRAVALLVIFLTVLGAGYYYFTQDTIDELDKVKSKEDGLKKEYVEKQGKAANLEAYKAQMIDMEKRFGSMLRQLPQKAEVADLLVEISQKGLSNNLKFTLFKPSNERIKEFYAELPVSIQVTGTYHNFGGFATEIAALSRIVTIHNVSLTPKSNKNTKDTEGEIKSDKELIINLIAKTYRYLDDDDKSGKKRKKRRIR